MEFLFYFLLGVITTIGISFWKYRRQISIKLNETLNNFFQYDIKALSIINRSFSIIDLPNLQIAITEYIKKNNANSKVIGYMINSPQTSSLRELIRTEFMQHTSLGPVVYRDVDIDIDKQLKCVENGIYLIENSKNKIVVNICTNIYRGTLELEVMSSSNEVSSSFIEEIREIIAQNNIYRGKVISLECDTQSWGARGFSYVRFNRLPKINEEEIILPKEVHNLIKRNTVEFFQHSEILKKSYRSVKRGILLYGKPGTGKTYTAKWLAQSLKDVTVIILTADQLRLVKECCQMARILAPSLVIMEDIDLIARERNEQQNSIYQITLHQLLNEMDGINSEAEVIFILTTNRPESIEPALAARPGRVDQAIEYPLPDTECRQRLFKLYSKGLIFELKDETRIIQKTEGASPAFIQELIRKASLIAAIENSLKDNVLCVKDEHFDMAFKEIIFGGGELTKNLLGFS